MLRQSGNQDVKLKKSSFQFLLEEATDPFQIITTDSILVYANVAWYRLLGYEADEVLNRSFFDVIEPAEYDRCQTTLQSLKSLQAANNYCELRTILLTKTNQWVDVHGKVVLQDSPHNGFEFWILWYEYSEPLTEELKACEIQLQQAHFELIQCKLIEEQLWDSEARFQRLISHLPGVIYRFESSNQETQKFTYISPGSLDLYELPSAAIVQDATLMLRMIHPEDKQSFRESVETASRLQQDWLWEGRIVTPSEQVKWLQCRSRPEVQQNGIVIWDGLVIDITDRKQAELELQESEALFRAIFDQAAVGINRVDLAGHFLQANQCFCDMIGYSESELQQLFVQEITHPDDWAVHEPLMQELARGEVSTYALEKRLIHKDGRIKWIHISVSLVRDDQGKPIFDVGVVQDIDDRKHAEVEIINALEKERELNQLKSRFIAIVSHEFRTPLTTIVSSADILQNFEVSELDRQKFLHQILNASYHMNSLLSDVVFLNKSGRDEIIIEPAIQDLRRLCKKIVRELVFVCPDNPLHFKAGEDECWIHVDEKLVRQILSNLISNAAKYSNPGSPVTVDLIRTDDKAQITVQDQGRGIPLEDQPLIFEFFHRAKNTGTIQGTGLGLAIVKRCVDLCRGEIVFESQIGKGSQFTVILPI
jgi:PAS domain S-box-containing protein